MTSCRHRDRAAAVAEGTALVVANEEQHDLCEFFMHARHQVCNPFVREVNVFYDATAADVWLRETSPAIVA